MVTFVVIILNNHYVKKKLSLFTLLFFLTACFASNNKLLSISVLGIDHMPDGSLGLVGNLARLVVPVSLRV